MIHFNNASIANGAVVGTGWFECLATTTHSTSSGREFVIVVVVVVVAIWTMDVMVVWCR